MRFHRAVGMPALAIAAIAAACLSALLCAAAPTAAAGTRAGSPRVTFYFGLKRPERKARRAFYRIGDPTSPRYRHFLTPKQAARRFGAGRSTIAGLRRAGRRHGLRVRVDRSRLFARITATERRYRKVFKAPIKSTYNNDVDATGYFVVGDRRLRLPKDIRRAVRPGEIVTSFARTKKRGKRRKASSPPAKPPEPGNRGTWTGGCSDARGVGAYGYGQVRKAYGIDALGPGPGASAAIMNVGEGVTAEDVSDFDSCFGMSDPKARTVRTDGQARPFHRGSFEPQEDYDLLRGMAPGLGGITFSQTWMTPELWFLGASQVLDLNSPPDVFSISYGQCERQVRGPHAGPAARAGARLMDSILARLGIVGVASFASAGDFGSTCNGQPFPGVTWPASSPFLTSVGGTRLVLDAANRRAGEVVWNDLPWLPADDGGGAGGGGFSAVSSRPYYQRGLGISRDRRAVPDVSAHASMLPGWPVVMAGNWIEDSGTSASAPLIAGAFAALSADQRALGRPPLGPVNGLLYRLGETDPSALFDVVSGDNGYSPKVRARKAGPGYDLASGLGVARFDRLARALPPPGS